MLSSSKAKTVHTLQGREVRCMENKVSPDRKGERGAAVGMFAGCRSGLSGSRFRRPCEVLPGWRTLCESPDAQPLPTTLSGNPMVGFPFPRAGSRQAIGSEPTTADLCGARTNVLSYLLICVLEATLEVILSKNFMLQETKPRQKKDKRYAQSHTTRE